MTSRRTPVRRAATFAVALLALVGCASTHPRGSLVTESATPAPPPDRVDRRLADAIDMLQHGRVDSAREELKAIRDERVNDKAARELLSSLEADPVEALGRAHFAYRTEEGDTMMSLAARFLHDPLKFYLLARYNRLADPSTLGPGQTLMIPRPGARPPAVRQAVIAPRPEPAARPSPAPEPAPAVAAAPPPVDAAKGRRLRAQGLEALDRGEVRHALALLEAASAADPADPAIQRDLARARRIAAAVATR